MYTSLIFLILLLNASILDGFVVIPRFKPYTNTNTFTTMKCIMQNKESYYYKNVIISNQTQDISNIYTTYDNRHSLIVYKNGSVHEHFNKSIKLRHVQDIIHLHIVSNRYFEKIYNEFIKKV
jgi:hypothetical protein